MLFKDSKTVVTSFVPDHHRTAFLLSLSRSGVRDVEWLSAEQYPAGHQNSPLIRVCLFRNPDHQRLTEPVYQATNELILNVFLEAPKTRPESLVWQGSADALAEAICYAEQRILQRNLFACPEVDDQFYLNLNLLGRSKPYINTMNMISKVARTDAPVFIRGETGTGKELTARAIHYLSDRRSGPFIPINCGAFTDDLILSELFGHQKGAFTGADNRRTGLLEMADEGTVFLDEVDALSTRSQVALLRFLQDREVRQVGSNQIRQVDVRVLSASNLAHQDITGFQGLRPDLMYRLDVLGVGLPPLRFRHEDLHLLSQCFLAQFALAQGHSGKVFHPSVLSQMQRYHWPGNVRELENFVQRAYLLFDGDIIYNSSGIFGPNNPEADEDEPTSIGSFSDEKQALIQKFERDYLHRLLSSTQGNISRAATIAQKERRSFSRLMQKHGLTRKPYLT